MTSTKDHILLQLWGCIFHLFYITTLTFSFVSYNYVPTTMMNTNMKTKSKEDNIPTVKELKEQLVIPIESKKLETKIRVHDHVIDCVEMYHVGHWSKKKRFLNLGFLIYGRWN